MFASCQLLGSTQVTKSTSCDQNAPVATVAFLCIHQLIYSISLDAIRDDNSFLFYAMGLIFNNSLGNLFILVFVFSKLFQNESTTLVLLSQVLSKLLIFTLVKVILIVCENALFYVIH